MASAQKIWLLIAILTATFIGYLVAQSLFQEAETQPEGADQGTEEPSYTEGSQEEYASDRIIVKLEEGSTRTDLERINEQNDASTEEDLPRSNVNVVELPQDLPVEEAVETYEASPDVEYAEPDYILKPSQTTSANDSYYSSLYGLNNSGQSGGTADADVDAPEAWNTTTGDTGTVVAVIDQGVDINHPDLKNNIWTNSGETAGNGVDDDRNDYVDDVNGWDFYRNDSSVYDSGDGDKHGTHVAGTIAAEGNNSLGVVGVNWKAKIMPLKFLGPDGGYTSDAVEALNYAVNKGVKISNNSWGGGGPSQALLDAINRADTAGHLFVAAAGNKGVNNDTTPHYPSSYNSANIVSVAATDYNDALASFSNYGSTSVDLAAPGVGILSTLPGNTYGSYNGTSMATPHVSGVAALLKSKSSSLDDTQLKAQILQSVEKKSNLSGKTATGGRANAAQALGVESATLTLAASPTLVNYSGTTALTGKLSGSSGRVPNKTVTVWRSTNGGSSWTQDGTATYDAASGTYKASRTLAANTTFQMRFAGDSSYTAATSPKVLVQARAYLSQPVTPSTVYKNTSFATSGYLKPYHSGYTRLYFYRYYSGKWNYYTKVNAPNAKYNVSITKYTLSYKLPYAGSWYVRAYHSDGNHAATWSPVKRFSVK